MPRSVEWMQYTFEAVANPCPPHEPDAMDNQFWNACENGYLDVVREMLALQGDRAVDVHAGGVYGFQLACENGHLDVVRELLALQGDRFINVHAGNEISFQWACMYGHLNVVRELLALQGDRAVDVHAQDEFACRWALEQGHLLVVRELLALEGARAPDPDVVRKLGLEELYRAVRWDRRRAMLVRRTAGQRAARAARAADNRTHAALC